MFLTAALPLVELLPLETCPELGLGIFGEQHRRFEPVLILCLPGCVKCCCRL